MDENLFHGESHRYPMTPESVEEAMHTLTSWLNVKQSNYRHLAPNELLRAWKSMAYLFPGLHPDDGLHNRTTIAISLETRDGAPETFSRYYEESGWPVALIPLLDEMWRRYDDGVFTDEEFYCGECAIAGILGAQSGNTHL